MAPPTQEELKTRLGLSARTNVSKLNTGTMAMTLEYAERIVAAVRQDDPTFSVADLGAPQAVVAEADPTVRDRLEELAAKLVDAIDRLVALEHQVSTLEARRGRGGGAPKRRPAQETP